MSHRSIEHGTFVIERTYDASTDRVFGAWASAEAKSAWFGPRQELELEFRVGGRERFVAGGPDGATYTYVAVYYDIVPDERIVYAYEMYKDQARISISVATIELEGAEQQTLLRMTEQGVFLDGHDTPAIREHGTRIGLDRLAEALQAGALRGG
ncbi:MAG: SRPBCC family protein [Solirubrobacteraceae bacterium]